MFRNQRKDIKNRLTKDLFSLGNSSYKNLGIQHAIGLTSSTLNDTRNEHPYMKAWGVLFNFRNKSIHSPLHDEVNSLQSRNYPNDFYDRVLEVALRRNYYFKFFPTCTETGWKIDAKIAKDKASKTKIGMVLLRKEDVVYNIEKGHDEPLGLQKLMLKQLENVSDMNILPIYESNDESSKDEKR